MKDVIAVQTVVNAPIKKVWNYWNEPEHIIHWTFSSDDWETSYASNNLQIGGRFKSRRLLSPRALVLAILASIRQ